MRVRTASELERLVKNYSKQQRFIYDVWDFVSLADNILKIETATKLARPGLEGVIPEIVNEFKLDKEPNPKLFDLRKQIIGRIIRILLVNELNSYQTDQKSVRIQPHLNSIFKTAMRYRKIKWGTGKKFHVSS